MVATTLPGVLLSGTHSARPAASAVASGTLYAETDTGQTYQSDGASTWTAWGAAIVGGSLEVKEVDGSPDVTGVTKIIVSNGTLTDNTGGSVTVLTGGGGGGASLLAIHTYTAGSDGYVTTGSATPVDIDATNFAITFTAPASGNVLVRVGLCIQTSGTNHTRIGLRETSSDIYAPFNVAVAVGSPLWLLPTYYLTGVSAGSHTYKASWDTDGTGYLFNGPIYGPYLMEVWAAP